MPGCSSSRAGGEHRGAQRVPVGGQGRAGMLVDGGGDRAGEGAVGVVPGDGADRGILHHQVELRDGGLDEPGHRRPPGRAPSS